MRTAEDALQNFLVNISARIPGKARANELCSELLDHLECKIEFFTGCGYEREQAIEKAISEMGDTEHVAEQMGLIHNRILHLDMKNALNRIVIGLLIQFFSIDIGLLQSIMTLIGVFLVLSGILQIRNTHARLRYASRASLTQCCFQAAVFLLSVAPIIHIDESMEIYILIAGIIQIVFLSMLGHGLADLVISASGGYFTPEFSGIETKINRISRLYLIMFVFAWVGTLDQGLSTIMLIPFIILTIMILSRLLKTKRFLLIQQYGTNVAEIRKPTWIGLALAGILVLILPWITTMIMYSIPDSFWEKSNYVPSGQLTEAAELIGQTEVDRIKQVFTDNEANMEILQSLPAAEFTRLEGLVEIYSLIQSVNVLDGSLENHSLILIKEDGTVESIYWFKWLEAPEKGGWDTVFLPRGKWYFSAEEPNSRIYIFTGDDADRRIQKPVRIRPGNNPHTVTGEGTYTEYDYFDYAVAKDAGQTIMICSTVEFWLASNIFQTLHAEKPDFDFYNFSVYMNSSRLGGMSNFVSSDFPGCLYVSRDKFKPHSYSASLQIAPLVPVHGHKGFGYVQSYAASVLEILGRN